MGALTKSVAPRACPVVLDAKYDEDLVGVCEAAQRLLDHAVHQLGSTKPTDDRGAAVRLWHLALGALSISSCRGVVTEVVHKNIRAAQSLHRSIVECLIRLRYFQLHDEEAENQWINRPLDFSGMLSDLGSTSPEAAVIAAQAAEAKNKLPKNWRPRTVKEMVVALEGDKKAGVRSYAHIYRWPSQASHGTTIGISTIFHVTTDGRFELDIYGTEMDPNKTLAPTAAAMLTLVRDFSDYYHIAQAAALDDLGRALDSVDERLGLRDD